MKAIDVHVSDTILRAIRRRGIAAFHQKKEAMGVLFFRRGIGEFHVEKLLKVMIDGASFEQVDANEIHFQALRNEARELGLEFGTWHTHINEYGGAPSKHDHTDGVAYGEVLMGILEIWQDKGKRLKTTLHFWQPQLPARVNIVHD